MSWVFVDTGGFYASLNRRDAYHREAARLFRRAQREHWFLCTTKSRQGVQLLRCGEFCRHGTAGHPGSDRV